MAREDTGLLIVTEAMDPEGLEQVAEVADIIQIGARNMQNYSLLKQAGRLRKPVLLKRGLSATIQELLLSAEYILAEGNPNVILCERGVRGFDTATRNLFDLSAIAGGPRAVAPADRGRPEPRHRAPRHGDPDGPRGGRGRRRRSPDRGPPDSRPGPLGRRPEPLPRAVRSADGRDPDHRRGHRPPHRRAGDRGGADDAGPVVGGRPCRRCRSRQAGPARTAPRRRSPPGLPRSTAASAPSRPISSRSSRTRCWAISTSSGRLIQAGTARLSMQFADPKGDALVMDGQWLWVYTPSTAPGQVIKMPLPSGPTFGPNVLAWLLDDPVRRYRISFVGAETRERHPDGHDRPRAHRSFPAIRESPTLDRSRRRSAPPGPGQGKERRPAHALVHQAAAQRTGLRGDLPLHRAFRGARRGTVGRWAAPLPASRRRGRCGRAHRVVPPDLHRYLRRPQSPRAPRGLPPPVAHGRAVAGGALRPRFGRAPRRDGRQACRLRAGAPGFRAGLRAYPGPGGAGPDLCRSGMPGRRHRRRPHGGSA